MVFVCNAGPEATIVPVDPALLSDLLLELGACSVTCTDQAKGTEDETPIFRHHSHSPTWRGSDVASTMDPLLVKSKGKGKGKSDSGGDGNDSELNDNSWTEPDDGGEFGNQKGDQLWQSSQVAATFPTSTDLDSVVDLLRLQLGLEGEVRY